MTVDARTGDPIAGAEAIHFASSRNLFTTHHGSREQLPPTSAAGETLARRVEGGLMSHTIGFSRAGYRDASVNFDGNAPVMMSVVSAAAGPDDRKEVQPMKDDEGRAFYRIPLEPK